MPTQISEAQIPLIEQVVDDVSLPSTELIGYANCTPKSMVSVELMLPRSMPGGSSSTQSSVVVTGVSGRFKGRRRANPSLPAAS